MLNPNTVLSGSCRSTVAHRSKTIVHGSSSFLVGVTIAEAENTSVGAIREPKLDPVIPTTFCMRPVRFHLTKRQQLPVLPLLGKMRQCTFANEGLSAFCH